MALTLVLSGCAGAATNGSGSRDETLIIGVSAVPTTLDPQLASDVQTDLTSTPVYDSLLAYDAEDRLVPALATEWKVADDAASVELTLRAGVTFHDGSPLTAKDVVYTLDRAHRLGMGVSALIADFESAEAVDDTHVTIELARPNSAFLGALSKVYVLNSALVAKNEGTDDGQGWLATHTAGSGPYTLESYTANQQAKFQKYPGYWDADRGKTPVLVYRYIAESATQRDELRSGNIDVAYDLTPQDTATLRDADGFTTTEVKTPVQLYLFMNTGGGPTADVRVRKAIRLSYDYTGHITGILSGEGTIANGPVPKANSCSLDRPDSAQDVAQAKKLLSEAGAEDTSLTVYYQGYLPEHAKAAQLLQSNLRDVGVDLELKAAAYPEIIKALSSKADAPDLVLLWDFPMYPDTTEMLSRVYDSRFVGTGSNYGMYANPKVDGLLAAAKKAGSPEKSCEISKEIQTIVDDDAVAANISSAEEVVVHADTVQGLGYSPTHMLLDPTLFTKN
ncbi:ABC transporter substrate-binding protein [Actinocorallia aurea]